MKEFSFAGLFENRSAQGPWRFAGVRRAVCLLTSVGIAMMLADGDLCRAQETPPPAAERKRSDPLEGFRTADRAVADAFAAFQNAVEAEIRVEPNALELQGASSRMNFLARFIESGEFDQLAFFLQGGSAGNLTRFPNVKKAREEFRAALSRREQFYKEQFPKALESFVAGTAKACREEQSPQQIAATLERLPEYEALEKRLGRELSVRRQFDDELRYLRQFKTFVAVQAAGDMGSLGAVSTEFEAGRLSAEASLQLKDVEAYRTRTTERIRDQRESEVAEILKAVPTVASGEQLKSLISKLEKLAAVEGMRIGDWYERYGRVLEFLREWRLVFSLELDERWREAAQRARRLKSDWSSTLPQFAALAEKRGELDAVKEEVKQQARMNAFAEKLPQRFAEISSPEALQEFVEELTPFIIEMKDAGDPSFQPLRSFQEELQRIVSAWRLVGADPAFAVQFMRGGVVTHPWAKESAPLRDKILRLAVAAHTGRTELLDSPLNQLPIIDAFRKLITAAAGSSDWERVHDLLQAQAAILPQPSSPEDLVAIKAYLTGLNLEKAELFADAVQSYRSVLRSTSQNVPIKETAERLKDLQSRHPELFKQRSR